MLTQSVKLASGDLVALDRVRLGKERAHIVDEGESDGRRDVYRLTGHEPSGLACWSHEASPYMPPSKEGEMPESKKYPRMFKTDAPLLRSATSDPMTSAALDYWEIVEVQVPTFEKIKRVAATAKEHGVR
jgi:hypothetical protein